MVATCPVHGTELERHAEGGWCAACGQVYRQTGRCRTCGAALERIAACGASNWFCPGCNELKSKQAIDIAWVAR